MPSPTILEKQILATIVYYDILDYPLTNFEVFLYLINHCQCGEGDGTRSSVGGKLQPTDDKQGNSRGKLPHHIFSGDSDDSKIDEIFRLLKSSEYLKEQVDQKFGFYFLKNREKIVQQRLARKKLTDQKWKKIKKIFWIMQIVPFVKMVLVSGSLSLGNSREESDVDLIIIAHKGRIWTVRTFVTLLTSILGVRRYKGKTKDRICLNHYITDESLKIPFRSLYNAESYVHLINVYDSGEDKDLFRRFQKENEWIRKYVSNYKSTELGSVRSIKRSRLLAAVSVFFEFILSGRLSGSIGKAMLKRERMKTVSYENRGTLLSCLFDRKKCAVRINLLERFGDWLERKLSEIQSSRIKRDPLYSKRGGRITINDDQLEFHPDSHESYIIPEFNRRMKELGLLEFSGQKDSGLNR